MKKILVADGILENAEKTANLFEGEFKVCKSCSERGVIDLCLKKDFALFICSYALRDITGMVLIKKIKQLQPGIKTVLISESIIPNEKEIEKLGINAFIERSFEPQTLRDIVDLVSAS